MKRTKLQKPKVLTCDPSFTAWGWAVLEGHLVVDHGCIRTEPEAKKRKIREGDDRVRRTAELVRELLKIIQRYKVSFIVSELPHGSQNAKAAVMMGVVVGVVQGISICMDVPVEWYSENDAKKALLNRKSISKREVIEAINELYEVEWKGVKYYDEAVADALAVYCAAEYTSTTLKILNR